jgi:aminoglycoside phosphotransferase (APT) family kinase protein
LTDCDAFPSMDVDIVGHLLADQFPQWADLPLARVVSAGTDNEIFRLGEGLAVRLPKVDWAVGQAEKEHRWLPRLAPHLPLSIPVPLALGEPGLGYPWPWAVCSWLHGDIAIPEHLADKSDAALALAGFITALQGIETADGPRSGRHNHGRGLPLAALDSRVRAALGELEGRIDVGAASRIWALALDAPEWTGAPVWLHGDLHAHNLLTDKGRLSAVIDFGLLGVGDPATDLMVAWKMFDAKARTDFRAMLRADGATWARARGWALYSGVIALPFYWDTNPSLVSGSLQTLAEVLSD